MECHVSIKSVVNIVDARLNALIVSPMKRILYLESACSSDASAHALMGCVSDDTGSREWRYYYPGSSQQYEIMLQPTVPGVNDFAREIMGFNRRVHHVAIVEKSGELILSKDAESLWLKLRSLMSCPTLEEWGEKLMPKILQSGLLVRCEFFGIDSRYVPYVLGENSGEVFDRIIGEHVRSIGGIPKRRCDANLVKV